MKNIKKKKSMAINDLVLYIIIAVVIISISVYIVIRSQKTGTGLICTIKNLIGISAC